MWNFSDIKYIRKIPIKNINIMEEKVPNSYEEFNKFQQAFYTSALEFSNFSNYEIRKHGYVLLNNLAKGFPHLASIITNLKGLDWKGTDSRNVLIALQRTKFVNNFNKTRIPQFIYYKNNSTKKSPEEKKSKVKATKQKGDKTLIDFSDDIKAQICSILFIDSKTYEYIKFGNDVQRIGNQLLGQFMEQEKLKKSRKKKEIEL